MSMPGFTAEASLYGNHQVVVQQFDWKCLVKCAAALAMCALAPNPVSCLINAGMSDCISCLQ